MTGQLQLLDDSGLVRNDHPETARTAARQVGARALRVSVLRALARSAMTDAELDQHMGHSRTVRPRRVELTRRGLVTDSGSTRTTDTGRQAIVWRITNAGRQELAGIDQGGERATA
jgi:hypothetical protein